MQTYSAHQPTQHQLLHQDPDLLVFGHHRCYITRYQVNPPTWVAKISLIPPISFLALGGLFVGFGSLQMQGTHGQQGWNTILWGLLIASLCFGLLQFNDFFNPHVPKAEEKLDLENLYLIRFDRLQKQCVLMGPVANDIKQPEIITENVIARIHWTNIKLAIQESQTTFWSDLTEQDAWKDEQAQAQEIEAIGFKIVGEPPTREPAISDFRGRFWIWQGDKEAMPLAQYAQNAQKEYQQWRDFLYGSDQSMA